MALRGSCSTGLVVLCFAALLLVSSFAADESSAARDAGRKMMVRGLAAAGDPYPPSYPTTPVWPPPYTTTPPKP
ncbi:unnamed protein product [Urochloa humidicola]